MGIMGFLGLQMNAVPAVTLIFTSGVTLQFFFHIAMVSWYLVTLVTFFKDMFGVFFRGRFYIKYRKKFSFRTKCAQAESAYIILTYGSSQNQKETKFIKITAIFFFLYGVVI